jgi:hypothetical protein
MIFGRTLEMSHAYGRRDSCAAGGVTDMAVGSGGFHEKACREYCGKRFTFFLKKVWGLGAEEIPVGQASIRTLGGGVNGHAVQ